MVGVNQFISWSVGRSVIRTRANITKKINYQETTVFQDFLYIANIKMLWLTCFTINMFLIGTATALTGKLKHVYYEKATACVTFTFTERTAVQKTGSITAHTAL